MCESSKIVNQGQPFPCFGPFEDHVERLSVDGTLAASTAQLDSTILSNVAFSELISAECSPTESRERNDLAVGGD